MLDLVGRRIGRIRIDALLGSGGMGEVYRGWDERLERPVALKAIQPEKRLSPAMRARFLREARLLSRLDHPNICRIYDVIEDESGDYLVLELIEGRTLRDLIADGASRDRLLPIAAAIARVLALAHGQGIIHRDLKPDNIMITAAGEVKVLDFGLARLVESADDVEPSTVEVTDVEKTAVMEPGHSHSWRDTTDDHTSAGSILGTLLYMSPEQASGRPLTEASDIYSFGALLYEMLSGGRSPYGEVVSKSELLERVRTGEILPAHSGDADLDRLVMRMLALQPDARPPAGEVLRSIEAVTERPQRVRRRIIIAASIAVVILLAIAGFLAGQRRYVTRALFEGKEGGKLAILPFVNETKQKGTGWFEIGLSNLVTQSLTGAQKAQVVPTDDVLKAMKNIGAKVGAAPSDAQRRRLLDALGADVLIASTVTSDEGKYTIRYSALGRERSESPREVASNVITEAASQMSASLARRIDPTSRFISIRDRYSFDDYANVTYAIGLEEMGRGGPKTALDYFKVCLDRDPDFAWARVYLATCEIKTGQTADVDQLLAQTMEQAKKKNDLALQAGVRVQHATWDVERGRYADGEAEGRQALELARKSGDVKTLVRSLNVIGNCLWRQNRLDEAEATFRQGLATLAKFPSPRDEAAFYNNLGIVAVARGRIEDARINYEKAIATFDLTGDRTVAATVLGNLSLIASRQRNYARAEALTLRQLQIAREMGDKETEGFALTNYALALYAANKEPEAIATVNQAIALSEQIHQPRLLSINHSNLVTAYARLGDLPKAREHLAAAEAIGKQIGDPEVDSRLDTGRAYLLIREGKLAEAEQALDRAEKLKPTPTTVVLRARLAYARGDYRNAARLASQAKAMDQEWYPQYEAMLRAFTDAASTGRPSSVRFEEGG